MDTLSLFTGVFVGFVLAISIVALTDELFDKVKGWFDL